MATGTMASSAYTETLDPEKEGEVIHKVNAEWKHPGNKIAMMFEGATFNNREDGGDVDGHCNYGMDGRLYMHVHKGEGDDKKSYRATLDIRELIQDFLDNVVDNDPA